MTHSYRAMTFYQNNKRIHRGGTQLRQYPDRYFYLKHVGWFVRTRGDHELNDGMEVTNGILGPYKSKAAAKFQLLKLVYEEHPELFDK
jgi:hypothetical protein